MNMVTCTNWRCRCSLTPSWNYCAYCGTPSPTLGKTKSQTGPGDTPADDDGYRETHISSEEEQFNRNIKEIRSVFDNLKRCRRGRNQLDADLTRRVAAVDRLRGDLAQKAHEVLELQNSLNEMRTQRDENLGLLREAESTIRGSEEMVRYLQAEVEKLKDSNRSLQNENPTGVRQIFGQVAGSKISEPLSILSMSQGNANCIITVRLPR